VDLVEKLPLDKVGAIGVIVLLFAGMVLWFAWKVIQDSNKRGPQ